MDCPPAVSTSRVIFIVEAPFVHRDYERLGVDVLTNAGFAVEVWDASEALQPWMRTLDSTALTGVITVREFRNHNEVAKAIRSAAAPSTIFVAIVGYRLDSARLFREFGRSRARYVLLESIGHPGNIALESRSFIQKLLHLSPKAIAGSVFARIAPRLFGICPPELVIGGGKRSITPCSLRLANSATRILWTHSLDYDLFLSYRDRAPIETGRYAVFIDQFLIAHPDQFQHGERFCNPDTYFTNLTRAFDDLERALGVRVVIAAHPQADYVPLDPRFGRRTVVFRNTGMLVKDAELVIMHDSTAISFAVLFARPVVFLTDNGVWSSDARRESALALSRLLSKNVYNLDEAALPSWKDELFIDEDHYRSYIEDFIKRSGSPVLPSWRIFADYLAGDVETLPISSAVLL